MEDVKREGIDLPFTFYALRLAFDALAHAIFPGLEREPLFKVLLIHLETFKRAADRLVELDREPPIVVRLFHHLNQAGKIDDADAELDEVGDNRRATLTNRLLLLIRFA